MCVVGAVSNGLCQVPVDVVFALSVMFSNVVCFVSIFRQSFVFSKTHVYVSTSLTNISGLVFGNNYSCKLRLVSRMVVPCLLR